MRPDLALISPYPRLGRRHDGDSGVASYTANLAHGLAAEGLSVTVVAPEVDGEPVVGQDGPVTVRREFRAGRPGAVPAALAAARRTAAPVVHLQHELFLYAGASGLGPTVAALARRSVRQEPAVVLTMHQVVDPASVTRAYTRMHRVAVPAPAARAAIDSVQRILPRLVDRVLVHEPAFARVISGAEVVPHGIEVPAGPGSPTTGTGAGKAALRAALGVPGDELIALCFGFLAPYKGIETALEAAALARGRSGDAADPQPARRLGLVVAGGAHPRLAAQGDDYAERLQRQWGDSATFTGYVPDAQVADWFRAADVLLLCYPEPHASSGPLALALAHRTPVLMSERLAATVGTDPALAVPPAAASWAERLTTLTRDPDALAPLAEQSARLAADRSWPVVARRHLDVYQEVLGAQRPAAADLALA